MESGCTLLNQEMNLEELIKAVVNFASLDDPISAGTAPLTFWIDVQPNSIVYGGAYRMEDDTYKPIDLIRIGGYNCSVFTAFLETFHQASTTGGNSKWNRARLERDVNALEQVTLIWDQEWEDNEIKAYVEAAMERGKWHWEGR